MNFIKKKKRRISIERVIRTERRTSTERVISTERRTMTEKVISTARPINMEKTSMVSLLAMAMVQFQELANERKLYVSLFTVLSVRKLNLLALLRST